MKEKEKIENYSKDIFFKSGFYKTTMDEIAQGLRISKKTIYKYFPSKNRLVDEIMNKLQNHIKSKLTKVIEGKENSIIKMRAIAQIFAELSMKLNQNLLYDIQTHRPDLWEKIEEFRGNLIRNIWEDIIIQGKEEGFIVEKPNEIIITIIYASLKSVINPTFLHNHNYSINTAFGITFDIVIAGILTPKGLQVYNKMEEVVK